MIAQRLIPIRHLWSTAPARLAAPHLAVVYRWLVVACTAATLLITWDLWQVRASPPMLPALPLPRLDLGIPLLAALGVVLVRPRIGVAAYALLLTYAMLIDQTRIQPQFVSFFFLLLGTLPASSARFVARAYLIALWSWAGINKALSPDFLASTGPGLLASLLPFAPSWLVSIGGYLIACAEFSIAALAISPRTRTLSALLAFSVHLQILLILSPLIRDWNPSVWGWNFALAFAGLVLIAPWRKTLPAAFRRARPLMRVLAAFLLIMPLGFYFGMVDAYLSHNLYSSNVPQGTNTPYLWTRFEVPFPPVPRLYEQNFQLTCAPGDVLYIHDERWWMRLNGWGSREVTCAGQ